MVNSLNSILRVQTEYLVAQAPSFTRDLVARANPLAWASLSSIRAASKNSEPVASNVSLTARGTEPFALAGQSVSVGDSGVQVKVSDLSIGPDDRDMITGGRHYHAPSFMRSAQATVTGTAGAEAIAINQDSRGNTIVEITRDGHVDSMNLGRIAAVTISGGGGDDSITVRAANYFGGIRINGGSGDDTIRVASDYALKRGVSIDGGDGDDNLSMSGKASAVVMRGGAGDDEMSLADLAFESGVSREASGGTGNDIIRGSRGNDMLAGDDGADLILAGEGDDTVRGGAGNDTLSGQAGDDTIRGGTDDDRISGDEGDDWLSGEAGSDILMGGSGGDILNGGAGVDYLYGGGSVDQIVRIGDSGRVATTGSFNVLYGGSGADTLAPSSVSPGYTAPYSGAGSYLPDYEAALDILV